MAFTVEDGTGLDNSNAYISLAFATSYFTDRGITDWAGSDTVKQQAIVRATDYIDTRFNGLFKGQTLEDDQALQWPREYAVDSKGNDIEGIPTALKKATAEYALRALSASLLPDPEADASGQNIKMKKEVVGPIEETTEYQSGSTVQLIKAYPAADRLLYDLLVGGQGRAIRA